MDGNSPFGPNFLGRGGEMGALMRAHDWASTPLGAPETWPQCLKTSVRLLLTTQHPMFIWWGADLIQFYNDAYRQTMGPERHPSALGQPGRECWEEIWDTIGPQIEFVMSGQGSTWHEQQLVPVTRYGKRDDVWWTYSFSPIDTEDGIGGVLVVCKDVTEEVQGRAALKVSYDKMRSMFQQAPGFMVLFDGPDHRFGFVNDAYLQLVGHRDLIGKVVRDALPEIEGQGFFELLDGVYTTGEAFVGRALRVLLQREPESALEERFMDLIYQPITDTTGNVTGIFVEGYDVTQRVVAEQQQHLLMREMNHRVKNLFAVASGMVALSARSASTPQEMAKTLRGRLDALARANDLIRPGLSTDQPAEGTTMDALIRTVLMPYVDAGRAHDKECIVLNGPAVPVGAKAITSLALVLHETTTNSAKYGSLSRSEGCVRVDWAVEANEFRLKWEESVGPEIVEPPQSKGFGSDLIKRSVTGQLGGSIEYDWRREGLTVYVKVPLERLSG